MSGRSLRRGLSRLLAAGAAVVLGGCGLGPGDDPDAPVGLTVTRDFGARVLLRDADAEVSGADTAMRVTQRNAKVRTRFGGDFVQSIAGVSGGRAGGRPVDWFIYVNGLLTDRGAGALRVAGGDRIWWDHHDWGLTPDVRAVVGSFPAPFVGGDGGTLPVRIDCRPARSAACDTVAGRLQDVSVETLRAAGPAGRALRVLVGAWPALRRDGPETASLERGPRDSGVFARFSAGGARLMVLDARGSVARRLGPGAGLVAATRRPGQPPVWVVTGTDDAGVAAAASALDARVLRERFALAIDAAGRRLDVPAAADGGGPG